MTSDKLQERERERKKKNDAPIPIEGDACLVSSSCSNFCPKRGGEKTCRKKPVLFFERFCRSIVVFFVDTIQVSLKNRAKRCRIDEMPRNNALWALGEPVSR